VDSFKSKSVLKVGNKTFSIFKLSAVKSLAGLPLEQLPYSVRILIENLLRREDGKSVLKADIEALRNWNPKEKSQKEIAFTPARVILQDFTGVPCVVDLAAMRDKMKEFGKDPKKINPLEPVDLVIDHSVQVDAFGNANALAENTRIEFERNQERYEFLKWGQKALSDFRAVPPGMGIVHQVNLEYLASVVITKNVNGETLAYPDTLVGTDSHTVMINGLGVLGWGVGGIEAEAAMLGQASSMLIPEVVGFKFTGKLPEGATATDLVLTVTQMLRKKGVVEKFVEFYGSGLDSLSLADRATVANMAPEYGATMGFFPVDDEAVNYLRVSGRSEEQIALIEAYLKEQGLFRTKNSPDPVFSDTLELDLGTVQPCLAGPKRPQDRVALPDVKANFAAAKPSFLTTKSGATVAADLKVKTVYAGETFDLGHGAVTIAAITSCTNTSNPSVLMAAGLVAKKAAALGLKAKPWVKTSLAPGSKVVTEYLRASGLLSELEKTGFFVVGYGCTTCIGNSGPLPSEIGKAVKDNSLVAAAVISGNRNFEGRVNPLVKANYLASPPLVVAYALAGSVEKDLTTEPIANDKNGKPVYLKDIWPTNKEVADAVAQVTRKMFETEYSVVFDGDKNWQAIQVTEGDTFKWNPKSTYIKKAPYFDGMQAEPAKLNDIKDARVLVMVGDSVTTDHISPAGNIAKDGPAAQYLMDCGVAVNDFNSYGARRGNHEVMVRGTFANIRLKNLLAPGTEGGVTRLLPEGKAMSIFDAAHEYRKMGTPLIVIAGKEYGTGSSRDWAAKGPMLLGVKAVIAESFERIHRSNLIGMGILPLVFEAGQTPASLGLSGEETFTIEGLANIKPGQTVEVKANSKTFKVKCRIDTPVELEYFKHGGILQYVLRQLIR